VAVALHPDEADELLRALSHPARRELLRLCWHERQPAGALTEALGLAAASVSEHLKVLRKSGLLVLHKQGTFRRYAASPTRVAALGEWLLTVFGGDRRG
jgi:DNA-binding transcriptional ArsR family regulator